MLYQGSYPVHIVWARPLLIVTTTLVCQLIVTIRASCLLKADLILKDLFVTPVGLWLWSTLDLQSRFVYQRKKKSLEMCLLGFNRVESLV